MVFSGRIGSVISLIVVLLISVGCQTLPVVKNAPPQEPPRPSVEDQRRSTLKAAAPDAFARFNHFGGEGFFASYPLALDAPAFMTANWAAVAPRLQTASLPELNAFARNYPDLDREQQRVLGTLYLAAYLQDKGDRSFKTTLAAHVEASRNGVVLDKLPATKIGVIEVTSQTLLRDGQIDFPVQIEADINVDVVKADMEQAFAGTAVERPDLLVLVNVAMATATRKVGRTDRVTSRTVVKYRREPNPEYDSLKLDYDAARAKVTELRAQAGPGGLSMWLKAADLLRHTAMEPDVKAAEVELQAVREQLRVAPRFIDAPVYGVYKFRRAHISAVKLMTVHYYVVDMAKKTYFTDTFDVRERQSFNVLYGLRAKDPERQRYMSESDLESDLKAWEKVGSSVKLSSLLGHYLDQKGSTQKVASFVALKVKIIADRNQALARNKDQRFFAKPDERFKSVVVINTLKGALGSGFYVRPDVIMTNYHVVEGVSYVEMRRHDDRETFGKVIAVDARLDLALIRVQDRGQPVKFYRGNTLPLGESVDVIGHPLRFKFSITRGVISAIRKERSVQLPGGEKVLFVQIDAPNSPGNSGGPVFMGDQVVGVVDWGFAGSVSQNLNFSIHYSEALRFIKEELGG